MSGWVGGRPRSSKEFHIASAAVRSPDCEEAPGAFVGIWVQICLFWGAGCGRPVQRVEEWGTWASRTRKRGEARVARPLSRGAWAAKTVKRPPQQPAQLRYANYWAPLTHKRHQPQPAQPQDNNDGAPRTRKQRQQENRPQRPTKRSDPTQHGKGRTGGCPGPRKETSTRRNVTQGAGDLDFLIGTCEIRGSLNFRLKTRQWGGRWGRGETPCTQYAYQRGMVSTDQHAFRASVLLKEIFQQCGGLIIFCCCYRFQCNGGIRVSGFDAIFGISWGFLSAFIMPRPLS